MVVTIKCLHLTATVLTFSVFNVKPWVLYQCTKDRCMMGNNSSRSVSVNKKKLNVSSSMQRKLSTLKMVSFKLFNLQSNVLLKCLNLFIFMLSVPNKMPNFVKNHETARKRISYLLNDRNKMHNQTTAVTELKQLI